MQVDFFGIEHLTYSGKQIYQRQQIPVICRCNCYAFLTAVERYRLFQVFNQLKNHEVRNTYLRGVFKKKELTIFGSVRETKMVLLETVTFTLCLLKRKRSK